MNSANAGILSTQLFPAEEIWQSVKVKIDEVDKRIELAGDTAIKDPVLALELIKAANLMSASEGKPPVSTVNTSLVRLGTTSAQEVLTMIKDRETIEEELLSNYFESARNDCRHMGYIAYLVAEVLANNFKDEALTIGTLMNIGQMITIYFLKEQYVELANNYAKGKLAYRLEKDHNINIEQLSLSYLKKQAIPEAIMSVLDRKSTPRNPSRQILKPVCATARELYQAAQDDKLDKFEPGKTLPLQSTLRIMQLKDSQLKQIYEKVAGYMHEVSKEE